MTTGIVLDRRYMDHDPGSGHPERPERIGVLVREALERPGVVRVEPRPATGEEITLVHGEGHFERVARTRELSRFAFDADTPVSSRSFARPATTPSATVPWASACSTTWRSLPRT